MAKPNKAIRVISLLALLTGAGTTMSAEQTRFDWKASESAPVNFPMQIINGTLGYRGDPNKAGLYVPSGGVISHGWGLMRSSHNTGAALKPLPDKLDITFFSYLEDQFYRGQFDLPYDTILRLFQQAEAGEKRKAGNGTEIPNDYMIIVGVAPGGTVAVWMRNQGTKELFFGKAEKVEIDFTKAIDFPAAKRAEFVRKIIESEMTPEVLAAIRQTGIPFQKWANYRTRYNWAPTFAVSQPPKEIGMSFYMGEGGPFKFPLEDAFAATAKPVPKRIRFSYPISGMVRHYYVYFDEAEILEAFTRLNTKQLPMQLEFDPKFPKDQTLVRLHNGKESIPLKKFAVKEK